MKQKANQMSKKQYKYAGLSLLILHCCWHNTCVCLPHHTTTVLRPFFRDHPGEPVTEENFWTLWCKGRLTEADTPTIRLGATPSGLSTAHLHHPPIPNRKQKKMQCPTDLTMFCSHALQPRQPQVRRILVTFRNPIHQVD